MYKYHLILVLLTGFAALTSYGWVCVGSPLQPLLLHHKKHDASQKVKIGTYRRDLLRISKHRHALIQSYLTAHALEESPDEQSSAVWHASYIPPIVIGSMTAIAVTKSRQIIGYLSTRWLPRYPVQLPVLAGLTVAAMTVLLDNELNKSALPMASLPWKQVCRRSLLRWFAMLVTIGGGCSLGVAGPSVEIGMLLAFLAATLLPSTNSTEGANERNTWLLAGAAAGFATNFNAPLSGILFASEVTAKLLPNTITVTPKVLSKVVCAVVAAVLTVRRGNLFAAANPVFVHSWKQPLTSAATPDNLILFASLGMVSSLAFRTFTLYKTIVRDSLKQFPAKLRPVLGGLLCAALAFAKMPQTTPWSFATMNTLSTSGLLNSQMATYSTTKMLATAVCLEGGLIGGVVAPLLFLGAMAAALYFQAMQHFLPSLTQGATIGMASLIGAAAMLSCHFKSLLMPMLLMAELTQSWDLVLALLLANLVAVAVTD